MPLLLLLRSFNLACRSVIIMCVVLRQKARRTERPVGIRTVVCSTNCKLEIWIFCGSLLLSLHSSTVRIY